MLLAAVDMELRVPDDLALVGVGELRWSRALISPTTSIDLVAECAQLRDRVLGGHAMYRSTDGTPAARPCAECHAIYDTGHGCAPQTSVAYCAIARSLENIPEHATLITAMRVHTSGDANVSLARVCVWRYACRSARCM